MANTIIGLGVKKATNKNNPNKEIEKLKKELTKKDEEIKKLTDENAELKKQLESPQK